ncbi:MAG: sensor domain-containing diguanylate cyclase [Deltaproteobacteria bacterium]|nr:sensor domain-containing diguanylate cyclase [Deltaproteobacteria bacterium]
MNRIELLKRFESYEPFCKVMLDAYALIDLDGKVIKSNQLLSVLLGTTTKQIQKADSIDQLLKMKVAQNKIKTEHLFTYRQPTRIDEVRGDTKDRENLNLILGVYPFLNEDKLLGLFLLIRDVTAETALQDKYKVKATQSITDNLSGLYNRHYFDQYLPSILDQLKKAEDNFSMSLLMADIDHFKKINDTYGHQAGDYVIESMSHLFKENCRKTDILCRYGGEEFLIIFPGAKLKDAKVGAEKLRNAVKDFKFVHNHNDIPVTISIGIAEISVGKENADAAIARADAALYHSKETGRNRVSVHQGGKIT